MKPAPQSGARVERARAVQRARFEGQRGVHANAHMSARDLRRHCRLSPPVGIGAPAGRHPAGSVRAGVSRVLKIARTIADLAGRRS